MGWLSGMLEGYQSRTAETRAANQAEDERNQQHEQSIFSALLQSPDPETKRLAIAGILHSGDPRQRQSGLRGWVGQMKSSPYMGMIQALSPDVTTEEPNAAPPADVEKGAKAGLAGTYPTTPAPTGGTQLPTAPAKAGGAALPTTGPTQVGSPPPAAPQPLPGVEEGATAGFHGAVPPTPVAPVGTHSVTRPREFFPSAERQAAEAGAAAGAKKGGEFKGTWNAALEAAGGDTELAAQLIGKPPKPPTPLMNIPGVVAFEDLPESEQAKIPDGYAGQTYRTITSRTGQRTYAPTTPQANQRPTGAAATALERAKEIQAAATAQGQTISDEDALNQARTETRGTRLAMDTARLGALRAAAVTAYQHQTGTTPTTPAQALAAARLALGNDPNVTLDDVNALAGAIRSATPGAGAVGVPPPARAATPITPVARPAGAAPVTPVAGTPPPTAPPKPGVVALPSGLGSTQKNWKVYSPQGKQTIVAIETMEPLLHSLEDNIRKAGLQDDNNALSEWVNKLQYEWHIDPGALEAQRLQLAGMADAYGLRGLLVGRSNQKLQDILNAHLVQAGDSPKLLLEKIQNLREAFGVVRHAVDVAENAHIGGGGRTTPTGPPPSAAGGKIIVTAPDGSQHPFDTQAQADQFKKLAGIK